MRRVLRSNDVACHGTTLAGSSRLHARREGRSSREPVVCAERHCGSGQNHVYCEATQGQTRRKTGTQNFRSPRTLRRFVKRVSRGR